MSGRIGLLCPGQGSQFVGMGRDLIDAYPRARETFEEANEILGFDLAQLCTEGPDDRLTETRNAQPALLVHTVAVWRVIEDLGLDVALAAGHSLGEFSAHVLAGTFSFADAVRVVRRRGELMFESGSERPGTMAAILGLDDGTAEDVCARASRGDEVVVPANYNSSGQIVISGDAAAVERAAELAREAGAKKVVPLNVSGAFHSPLMRSAADGLRTVLAEAELSTPAFPVVSNVTTEPVTDQEAVRALLVEQLTSPVRWAASVERMRVEGVDRFLEPGPGKVLTGLLRRIDRKASGRTVGTAEDVQALREEGGEGWS